MCQTAYGSKVQDTRGRRCDWVISNFGFSKSVQRVRGENFPPLQRNNLRSDHYVFELHFDTTKVPLMELIVHFVEYFWNLIFDFVPARRFVEYLH